MRLTRYLGVPVLLLFTALPATAQEVLAPNISGTSVRGRDVNLNALRDDKSVLVVFYRMHT